MYSRLSTNKVREHYAEELDESQFDEEGYFLMSTYDLVVCLMSGIRVTHKDGVLWRRMDPIYKEHIDDLYKRRMAAKEAGNKALSQSLKLMMNSLFGQTARKDITTKHIILNALQGMDLELDENRYVQLPKRCAEENVKDLYMLPNEQIMVEYSASVGEVYAPRSPSQVACCILALSRYHMFYVLYVVSRRAGFFRERADHIYYQDTDSFYVSQRLYQAFKDQGYIHSGLGGFKNEHGDGRIVRFFSPGPKMKVYRTRHLSGEMQEHVSLKGYNGDKDTTVAAMWEMEKTWEFKQKKTNWTRSILGISTEEVDYTVNGEQHTLDDCVLMFARGRNFRSIQYVKTLDRKEYTEETKARWMEIGIFYD